MNPSQFEGIAYHKYENLSFCTHSLSTWKVGRSPLVHKPVLDHLNKTVLKHSFELIRIGTVFKVNKQKLHKPRNHKLIVNNYNYTLFYSLKPGLC